MSCSSSSSSATIKTELECMGINLHDEVVTFWNVYGERMKSVFPEMVGCASKITPEIMEHGIISVGGMSALTVGEMEECITAGGGRAKWAKGVLNLLNRSQCGNLQARQVPLSAELMSTLPPHAQVLHEKKAVKKETSFKPYYPDDKLGVRLMRDGTLDACKLPKDRLLAVVLETKDPHLNVLSYNDTVAVMSEVFAFIFNTYGNIGGCGTLFDNLASQLDVKLGGIFARPHGKLSFRDKIVNRFKTGRRPEKTLLLSPNQSEATCDAGKRLIDMGLSVRIKSTAAALPNGER